MHIDSKLPNVTETIFTTMSALAQSHQALNMGQGFPDFDPDPNLTAAVTAAMASGMNQYAPMAGLPALREAVADKIQHLYGHQYDPDQEVTITSGATEGIMVAFQALLRPGDEVIIIEPAYDMYLPCTELTGAVPVLVPLNLPDHPQGCYQLDWNRLKQAISNKTRLIVLNFPHNPTGITLDKQDLNTLYDMVKDRDIFLLADEVYEHITFDGQPFASLCTHEGLRSRSYVISSFGKTYHTTGWKIGYCCAPAAMTAEFRKVHQFTVFAVSTPMQAALSQFASQPHTYEQLSDFYQQKHDQLYAGLLNSRFKPLRSQGTFFLLASYKDIADEPEADFAIRLTKEFQVTAIPMSAFYRDTHSPQANNQMLRFCFAKSDAFLERAIERLQKI